MTPSVVRVPPDVGSHVVYGCAGPRPAGVCLSLRLPFRDETQDPPTDGHFDHQWVVSSLEMDQAEREGRSDDVLLRRRAKEERVFLEKIERTLERSGARLQWIGQELVMRRADA